MMNDRNREYGRYINGGFQIIIPILLGVYFGIKLDEGKKFPLWTLILSLLGIAIGLYSFIKEVTKSKGKK